MKPHLKSIIKIGILTVLLLTPIIILTSCAILTHPFVTPQVTQVPAVDETRLKQHVHFLSQDVYPRNYQHLENLNETADYIKRELVKNSHMVTEQTFTVNGKTYRNIIARFGSSDEMPIVVGAHYDSFADTPGADDNASGVAGMLELAQLLKENPPKRPVELIAYTLEEPPFFRTKEMGSAVHAQSLKEQQRPIKFMIALEMIGYFDDRPDTQDYPVRLLHNLYPNTGNFIAVAGRLADRKLTGKIKGLMAGATDLPIFSLNAPTAIGVLDFSDHLNYWNEGFNAVIITDTAFFRNKNYHELTDTPDTLDYQRMAKVVQGVYAVVQHIEY